MPPSGHPTVPDHRSIPVPESTPRTAAAPSAGPAPRSARRAGLIVTLVLGGLNALPPLSMDMYLPALPEVTGA
ncbi:Bcr/CflA family drug resistance efflux transporter, partial [Streptomyces sp. MCAF7]